MEVRAVLFDADGVVQQPAPTWFTSWVELVGGDEDTAHRFLTDIFAAETPFLKGGDGFENAISSVLEQWNFSVQMVDVLKIWTLIEPAPDIMALLPAIRSTGVSVGLATNQQQHRIDYMRSELGYSELFDHFVVSCEIGESKPDTDYFHKAIDLLNLDPGEILFFDDKEPNVEAARSTGIRAEVFHFREGQARMIDLLTRNGVTIA
ncbi:MAG: HAD-IA family hydrolase [Pseudomonadales bacterium]|nr:HAD-IA family hydrolase [Pseudomonadales bacterium]